jgi:hypothetical protein
VIGICPSDPDNSWAVSPVINGVEKIPRVAGTRIGVGIYVDPDDPQKHFYLRQPSGYFYLEKDKDKFIDSPVR